MKKRLSLLLSLGYCILSQGIFFKPATAQITPDGTTNTTVDVSGSDLTINQGDRAGSNLFHSFSEFSVPTDSSAFFNNAADIVNIFSRVTGGNISNIDGLLGANGTANLFLINPAGIIFGESARLDIGGSFYGSSADSILFPDDMEFSAKDSQAQPMLTINAPIGLNFRDNPGNIVNRSQALDQTSQSSVGLQVQPGKTLALIGGDLNFNGGILTVPGGNLELGSVSSSSLVSLNETTRGLIPEYEEVENFGNIQLNQQAIVNASGLGGGAIQVQGKQLSIQDGSQIISITQGELMGGNISINTSELVELSGMSLNGQIPSSIQNATQGAGNGGDLVINTGKLMISDGALISAATFAQGMGGDINITTSEGIEIIGNGYDQYQETFIRGILLGTLQGFDRVNGISVGTLGTGESGSVFIDTPYLQMSNGASIFSPVFASGIGGDINIDASESIEIIGSALQSGSAVNSTGPAGDIIVKAKDLKVGDGGIIVNATLGNASGGNIIVNVADSLELFNTPFEALIPGGILANSSRGMGKAGDIKINTSNLFINDGAVINNNSGAFIPNPTPLDGFLRLPGGIAGNIEINASNLINLNGISPNGVTTSGIGAGTFDLDSPAGDINISTDSLVIQDGARIGAPTIGSGNAGKITIKARESITIKGSSQLGEVSLIEGSVPSGILATSGRIDIPFEATGKAGDINITTGNLTIQDGAEISINSISLGEAGNLQVIADSISLENQGTINASTSFGQGGNIILETNQTITMRDGSLISARAGSIADGGNVTINSNFIVAFPNQNNDIIASAEQGQGGNIDITAEALFGIEERPLNDITNDINASSEFGLDGTISIFTPDVNTLQTDTEIPSNPIESEQAIGQACQSNNIADKPSGLTVKGKGGVPAIPTEPFMADALIPDGNPITVDEKTDLTSLLVGETETEQRNPHYLPAEIKPIKTSRGDIYPARGIIKTEDGQIILTRYSTDKIDTRTPHKSANCTPS